jgi:hypothetical protein
MAETDPWADRADDIRRTARAAETAEVWQARAAQAEARVAELEAAVVRAAGYLRDDLPRTALNILEATHA